MEIIDELEPNRREPLHRRHRLPEPGRLERLQHRDPHHRWSKGIGRVIRSAAGSWPTRTRRPNTRRPSPRAEGFARSWKGGGRTSHDLVPAAQSSPTMPCGSASLDRTFEHGLGLFETFRTWNGQPTAVTRHLERLRRSARELELPLEPGQLARCSQAVTGSLEGCGCLQAAMSGSGLPSPGGVSEAGQPGSTVWMAAGPLPPPTPTPGAPDRAGDPRGPR